LKPALTALFALTLLSQAMDAKPAKSPASRTETALFAGGCFWCMQPPFEQLEGVTEVLAGYTGGTGKNPTYEDYVEKGHTEAVQVAFDPTKTSYAKLLDVYWRQINPTDPDGQFADRGPGYYAAIYCLNDSQKAEAEKSKAALNASGKFDKPVVTKILKAGPFTPAEEHHQGYSRKNSMHYKLYKMGSGRQGFLDKVWGSQGH
jgi:peptide methionine sulfoxide reductase msrA/msrB